MVKISLRSYHPEAFMMLSQLSKYCLPSNVEMCTYSERQRLLSLCSVYTVLISDGVTRFLLVNSQIFEIYIKFMLVNKNIKFAENIIYLLENFKVVSSSIN